MSALLLLGDLPVTIGVATHAYAVIGIGAIGQVDLGITPAAFPLIVIICLANDDCAAHATVRITPVIRLVMLEGIVHCIMILGAVAIIETVDRRSKSGSETGAEQNADTDIAFIRRCATDQCTKQCADNRAVIITVIAAQAVIIGELATIISVGIIAIMIAPPA